MIFHVWFWVNWLFDDNSYAEIRYFGGDRGGRLRSGPQMQEQRHAVDPRHKEVQINLGRWDRQKNHHARGQDPQDGTASKPGRAQGSIQEEGNRIFSVWVCSEQSAWGLVEVPRWIRPRTHTFFYLPITERTRLLTFAEHHAQGYKTRELAD